MSVRAKHGSDHPDHAGTITPTKWGVRRTLPQNAPRGRSAWLAAP